MRAMRPSLERSITRLTLATSGTVRISRLTASTSARPHRAVLALDQHGRRIGGAGRECLLERPEAVHALRVLLEGVGDAVVLLVGQDPERAAAEDERGDDQRGSRVAA